MNAHPASEENLGFLLWRVSTLWSSSTAAALKEFGLTHPHFIILATIDWLTGKGASQEQIGRHIVLDPKLTAHLLRSLQVKGLIELSHNTDEENRFPLTHKSWKGDVLENLASNRKYRYSLFCIH